LSAQGAADWQGKPTWSDPICRTSGFCRRQQIVYSRPWEPCLRAWDHLWWKKVAIYGHFSAQLRQLVAVAVKRPGDAALIGGIENFLFGPGPGGIREFALAAPLIEICNLLSRVDIAGGRGPPTAGAAARLPGARIGAPCPARKPR
jgi:hypothetical protein